MNLYDNNIKEEWRRWAWKQLSERCAVQTGLATAIFLCGPQPSDIAAAQRKGFRKENLIAVDLYEQNIQAARNEGVSSVCGTIESVIGMFTESGIHAVLADFCGGLSAERYLSTSAFVRSINGGVVLNFQRGRESSKMTTLLRSALQEHGLDEKHRGVQYVVAESMMCWHVKEFGPDLTIEMIESADSYLDTVFSDVIYAASEKEIADAIEFTKTIMSPVFYSYRANNVYMDSVAVSNRVHAARLRAKRSLNNILNQVAAKRGNRKRKKMSQKMAALAAIRTMRQASRHC